MNARETLIELLAMTTTEQVFCTSSGEVVSRYWCRAVADEDVARVADHLIANGGRCSGTGGGLTMPLLLRKNVQSAAKAFIGMRMAIIIATPTALTAALRWTRKETQIVVRKIELMHWYFGKLVGRKCRECSNLITGQYHDKTLRKCAVYGLTHSEASDWALKHDACGMFNKEWNGRPIIRLVKVNSAADAKKLINEPLEGQMTFEEVEEE